jgi:hypothetical protein
MQAGGVPRGFGTWALAAQLSAFAVRPATSLRPHVSTTPRIDAAHCANSKASRHKEAASRRQLFSYWPKAVCSSVAIKSQEATWPGGSGLAAAGGRLQQPLGVRGTEEFLEHGDPPTRLGTSS